MRQASLVAFYGPKPPGLAQLITSCQTQIHQMLGDRFMPYDLRQVHATIVSLERVAGSSAINLNFLRCRQYAASMDFTGLLTFLRSSHTLPLDIQIGGFHDRDYSFTSRGQRPYARTFSIQGAKAVVMGWPIYKPSLANLDPTGTLRSTHASLVYSTSLESMRRTFQNFNILHSYHCKPADVDNDFYFRLGLIEDPPLEEPLHIQVEYVTRRFLAAKDPVFIKITLSDIYVISYEDETLPTASSTAWSVSDPHLTPLAISKTYYGQ